MEPGKLRCGFSSLLTKGEIASFLPDKTNGLGLGRVQLKEKGKSYNPKTPCPNRTPGSVQRHEGYYPTAYPGLAN